MSEENDREEGLSGAPDDVGQAPPGQLAFIAEASRSFASSLNIGETLHNAIDRFMKYLDAEAASIFLLENDDAELVCRACAGPIDINGLRLDADHGIVGKTVRLSDSQIVRDVSKDPDFSQMVDSDTGFITRSILCAPLTVKGCTIGALELMNKRGGDGLFNEHDRHLTTVLASSAALAIHNAWMAAALVEQERMQTELELARDIQRSLLPGVDESLPVAGINLPAREVSGDFFDFLQLDDGSIYFSLADVSGKGMNAAMLMAKTSSLLRCLVRQIRQPGALMAKVNNEVYETATRGMFVTAVAGLYRPDTGEICLSNAGHQPPLHAMPDGDFREIPATAPPLGIAQDFEFPETRFALGGGSLYLFTDGVTEALAGNGQQLGVEGFIGMITALAGERPMSRLESIVSAIGSPGGQQHDDITLLLIEQ